ncbi:MAG: hypothetical protein QGH69_05045 [Alphaproteobacteria bacterium]|nr:hypothetical protein [Alphaproteobacteria bacterium]
MNDWIFELGKACNETSQRTVAARIGYSPTTISLVLKGNYTGDIKAVENAVRRKLMRSSVCCPVLGDISATECSTHQKKPFSASSSVRVRLFKACKQCPFNTRRKDAL